MFSTIVVTVFKNELSWIAWNCIILDRHDFESIYLTITVMVLKIGISWLAWNCIVFEKAFHLFSFVMLLKIELSW